MKYPKLPCAIALLMACGSDRAIARPTTWNDYTNVRFAYRACYPNWLRAGRESDDGDGRIFTDKFGGEMRVFGSYVAMVLIDGKEVLSSEAPAATPVRQAADFDGVLDQHRRTWPGGPAPHRPTPAVPRLLECSVSRECHVRSRRPSTNIRGGGRRLDPSGMGRAGRSRRRQARRPDPRRTRPPGPAVLSRGVLDVNRVDDERTGRPAWR